MSNGHRWSKFWWADWQNDKGLQSCGLAARGLWIEMLGLCHASGRPGYLLVNGAPPTNEDLADMLGRTTAKEVSKLLEELERRKVFSREDGVIYSRRMVRDIDLAEAGRAHVAKRYPTKDPTSHPSRGPTYKPNGQPKGKPTRDPTTKKLEAEAEAEAEKEERQEDSKTTNLSSSVPRERAREESPQEAPLDNRSSYDQQHDVPSLEEIQQRRAEFAADNAGLVTPLANILRMEPIPRPYGPVRSRQQQINELNAKTPDNPDTMGVKWQPAEPVRTPAQQLVQLLDITIEEAERRLGGVSHG